MNRGNIGMFDAAASSHLYMAGYSAQHNLGLPSALYSNSISAHAGTSVRRC